MAGLRQKKVGAWGVGSGMFWGGCACKRCYIILLLVRVLGAFGVSIAEVQVP